MQILAFPFFYTSNPSPLAPALLVGSNNSVLNLANLALSYPM
jgi:hypothetical protein